ncbi:tRNA-i(6)A37 methylthiotransferase [Acetivibrio straminisolvens JCM 21531]|uniref:tRNA-i(6)A37 methylthiotransferase n=1 Tax=Acetivibrio straminisolvens JCM 21531 TaxID=1294263 RepID=W4V3L0_9FIRM|nr:tRNA-i(6)A37 methylthiotransferase [Acetivibrio straminisolvens JCM 21531]
MSKSNRKNICVSAEEMARQQQFIDEIKELNYQREIMTAKKKLYYLATFGCQMNEHDSEKLAGMLAEMGYAETDNMNGSDLIIYNTCCVRENAELKVYGHLGPLKHLKKKTRIL